MTIEQLEKKGVDPIALMKKTNLCYLLTDIIDTLATEIEVELKKAGLYIHENKQNINKLKKLTSNMVEYTDKVIADDKTCEDFSDDSDYLYKVLMLLTEKKNHLQVISTLKMIK